MTVALRGTPQIGSAINGGDVTLTFDVTPVQGDVVILFGGRGNSNDANAWGPITTGYTLIASIDTTTAPKFGVWWKKMGASPDTQVQGAGGASAAHGVVYGSYVIDGSTIASIIFDQTATSTGEVTAVPDGPAITTQRAGAWVVTHAGFNLNDVSRGTVTNYTLIPGASVNETDDMVAEAAYREIASPGAENPPAWSTWASSTGGAITIAVRPAFVDAPTETFSFAPVVTDEVVQPPQTYNEPVQAIEVLAPTEVSRAVGNETAAVAQVFDLTAADTRVFTDQPIMTAVLASQVAEFRSVADEPTASYVFQATLAEVSIGLESTVAVAVLLDATESVAVTVEVSTQSLIFSSSSIETRTLAEFPDLTEILSGTMVDTGALLDSTDATGILLPSAVDAIGGGLFTETPQATFVLQFTGPAVLTASDLPSLSLSLAVSGTDQSVVSTEASSIEILLAEQTDRGLVSESLLTSEVFTGSLVDEFIEAAIFETLSMNLTLTPAAPGPIVWTEDHAVTAVADGLITDLGNLIDTVVPAVVIEVTKEEAFIPAPVPRSGFRIKLAARSFLGRVSSRGKVRR